MIKDPRSSLQTIFTTKKDPEGRNSGSFIYKGDIGSKEITPPFMEEENYC